MISSERNSIHHEKLFNHEREPLCGSLIVVIGPTAAGKNTLVESFLKAQPQFNRIVTATTRERRPNEQPGEEGQHDYDFMDTETFEALNAAGYFFETQNNFHGRSYGTPKSEIEAILQGENKILLSDMELAINLEHELHKNFEAKMAQLIFEHTKIICIAPARLTVLRDRYLNREHQPNSAALTRSELSKKFLDRISTDMAHWEELDKKYHLDPKVKVVINMDLETAISDFTLAVLT